MIWKGRAPAKINLALHVTGQRADGYHLLDSLVVFADVADHITLAQASQMSLTVSGPFAEGVPSDARNLMWKAAELAGGGPWAMSLDKNLPHPAGIGGGSCDAATVLRGIAEVTGASVAPDADRLGADVPVCLAHHPQHMRGIGDRLAPIEGLPEMALLLVNPKVSVPTGPIFAKLSSKDNPGLERCPVGDYAAWCHWLTRQRNDLEPPAIDQAPVIAEALAALRDAGSDLARMSGSGATCFGLFRSLDLAAEAGQKIATRGWWVKAAWVLNG